MLHIEGASALAQHELNDFAAPALHTMYMISLDFLFVVFRSC